jgi:hypothetical protein
MWRSVFEHDRVIDDEPGGDGERHQRQVIEAETAQMHHAEVPINDTGTRRSESAPRAREQARP